MTTPSKAELFNQLAHACRLINEYYKYCTSNTRNFLTDSDSFQQVFEGNHIPATQAALEAWRTALGAMVLNGKPLLQPILQDLGRIGYYSVETDISRILDDIYAGMVAAAPDETITNRAWTFQNAATGLAVDTLVGDATGACYRLTKDENDYSIESGSPTAGVIYLECIRDMHHGLTSGREEFAVYGYGKIPYDQIDVGTCTGVKGLLYATRAHDGIIANPSFDTFVPAVGDPLAATTDLTGWTTDANFANLSVNQTAYYRREPGRTYGTSLQFDGNAEIYQYLTDNNAIIDPTAPLFVFLRYDRETGSGDGTITLTVGSKSVSVVLAAQTGWNDLTFGVGTQTAGWYKNYGEIGVAANGVIIKVALSSNTTGYVLIDEIIVAQPSIFDGRWYNITAGSVDYLKGDIFSYTDTVSNTGIIQYHLSRLFGKYLPHTSGSPTYSDTPT